jgi:hypothetical protein
MWRQDVAMVMALALAIVVMVARAAKPPPTRRENFMLAKIREMFVALDPRYGDIPLSVTDKGAYTIDKREIYICVEDPKTKQPYPQNQLAYVALHELAHVLTPEYDEHGPQFLATFAKLRDEAWRKGVYDPSKPLPPEYCGVT